MKHEYLKPLLFAAVLGIFATPCWAAPQVRKKSTAEIVSKSTVEMNNDAAKRLLEWINSGNGELPPFKFFTVLSPEGPYHFKLQGQSFTQVQKVEGARFSADDYEAWYKKAVENKPQQFGKYNRSFGPEDSFLFLPQGIVIPVRNGRVLHDSISADIPSLIEETNKRREPDQLDESEPDSEAVRQEIMKIFGVSPKPAAKIDEPPRVQLLPPQPLSDSPEQNQYAPRRSEE